MLGNDISLIFIKHGYLTGIFFLYS